MNKKRFGFTLVELLVVIGIIALLISILLPALSAARRQATMIKSGANMRSIGQAMQLYLASFKNVYPAAYVYEGMTGVGGTQLPTVATNGYRHISSFLYGHENIAGTLSATGQGLGESGTIPGAEAMRNPWIESGGLPPTNPAAGNVDPGQTKETLDVVDFQVPRIGYVFNEAICPRNKLTLGFQGTTTAYHFVNAGTVSNSSNTILASEVIQDWRIVSGAPRTGGASAVCKSHRPIHAFTQSRGGVGDANLNMEKMPATATTYYRVRYQDLYTDSPKDYDPAATKSRLDWVGRYNGGNASWERKNTSFLYCDGHVENKNIRDTLDTNWEWGDRMFTLDTKAFVTQ